MCCSSLPLVGVYGGVVGIDLGSSRGVRSVTLGGSSLSVVNVVGVIEVWEERLTEGIVR